MQNRWLIFVIIGSLTFITFLFYAIWIRPIDLSQKQATTQTQTITEPTITFVNPAHGAATPRVTIVEFSDFECAHCKTVQSALDVAIRTYPDDVRVIWKNLPNPTTHPQSIPAAIAAHCADRQGKFWEYHDLLFARQTFLSDEQFTQIARELKLDVERFSTCVTEKDTLPIVEKDATEGRALNILATPTLLIEKEKIVGTISSEELLSVIEGQLSVLPK